MHDLIRSLMIVTAYLMPLTVLIYQLSTDRFIKEKFQETGVKK